MKKIIEEIFLRVIFHGICFWDFTSACFDALSDTPAGIVLNFLSNMVCWVHKSSILNVYFYQSIFESHLDPINSYYSSIYISSFIHIHPNTFQVQFFWSMFVFHQTNYELNIISVVWHWIMVQYWFFHLFLWENLPNVMVGKPWLFTQIYDAFSISTCIFFKFTFTFFGDLFNLPLFSVLLSSPFLSFSQSIFFSKLAAIQYEIISFFEKIKMIIRL